MQVNKLSCRAQLFESFPAWNRRVLGKEGQAGVGGLWLLDGRAALLDVLREHHHGLRKCGNRGTETIGVS